MGTFIAASGTVPASGVSRPRIGKMLDYAPAWGAFGLFKMRGAYTGAAVKVRRSSDNTTLDIGFLANGELDEAALLAFAGNGSAFAQTWYDQSGNNRHVTDALLLASNYTTAVQPRIVNNGTIDKLGGKPCLVASGAQALSNLEGASFVAMGGQVAISLVQIGQNAATGRILTASSTGGTNPHLDPLGVVTGSPNGIFSFQSTDVSSSVQVPGVAVDAAKVFSSVDTGTAVSLRVNGTELATLPTYARTNSGTPFNRFSVLGSHNGPSNNTSLRSPLTGKVAAIVVLPLSTVDFGFIETKLAKRAF